MIDRKAVINSYHPSGIKYCSVYKYLNNYEGILWEEHPYKVYSSTSLFILDEIIRRWENSSFFESCWWEARTKNLLCTKLSILSYEICTRHSMPCDYFKENKREIITYEGNIYTFIGSGLKRKVYLSEDGTYVIKIPQIILDMKKTKLNPRYMQKILKVIMLNVNYYKTVF